MKHLLANLALAALWIALTTRLTLASAGFGLLLGYLVLRVASAGDRRRPGYFRKVPQSFRFLAFLVNEIVVSSLRVARDVVTSTHHMRPAIIAIPLEVESDAEITLLSCLLTLTPGTLSVDLSADRKRLFIHAMYLADEERLRATIKDGFERRVLRLMR